MRSRVIILGYLAVFLFRAAWIYDRLVGHMLQRIADTPQGMEMFIGDGAMGFRNYGQKTIPLTAVPGLKASVGSTYFGNYDTGHGRRGWAYWGYSYQLRRLSAVRFFECSIGYLPLWFLSLPSLLLVALNPRVLRRRQPGCCANCGYDIATPDRCPECGAVPAASSSKDSPSKSSADESVHGV